MEAPSKAPKTVKFEEFIKHNTEDDCWISVRGKVYDVTQWIKRHPGGVDTIVLNGGRDATQLFEAYHPTSVWDDLTTKGGKFNKYYLGDLDRNEYPQFPPLGKFYLTLKKKIEEHFQKKGYTPRHAPEMVVRAVGLLFALFFFHYLTVTSATTSLALIYATFVGVTAALISFMPVHEGSHASTTSSPLMWRLMGSVHDWANGASFYNWCHQHFLGHHPFTNVTDTESPYGAIDPDVATNEPDVRRIKPNQQFHDRYKYQVYYAPLLYGLLGLKFRINDFVILFFTKMNGHVRVNPMNTWHTTMFFGGKAFFLFYRIILPSYYISFWSALGLFIWSDLITGWILAFVFQVNHVVPQAKWPTVDKNGKVNMDWAEMQVITTMDYAHDSPITTFLTGALNYQVTHHLFPSISQIHYPEIAPIIKAHCREYGIRYTVLPTFWDAFKAHLTYLSKMGHAHYDF